MSLVCQEPTPTITWRKAVGHMYNERSRVLNGKLEITNVSKTDGGDYICSAKNILNEDSAHTQVMVFEQLKFTLLPPHKRSVMPSENVLLTCKAQGAREVVWQRNGQGLPSGHILFSNIKWLSTSKKFCSPRCWILHLYRTKFSSLCYCNYRS